MEAPTMPDQIRRAAVEMMVATGRDPTVLLVGRSWWAQILPRLEGSDAWEQGPPLPPGVPGATWCGFVCGTACFMVDEPLPRRTPFDVFVDDIKPKFDEAEQKRVESKRQIDRVLSRQRKGHKGRRR
jgi:hypothetical protein